MATKATILRKLAHWMYYDVGEKVIFISEYDHREVTTIEEIRIEVTDSYIIKWKIRVTITTGLPEYLWVEEGNLAKWSQEREDAITLYNAIESYTKEESEEQENKSE